MNYWVCRGRAENNFKASLKRGRIALWHTARRPRQIARGDLIFLWESSPHKHLIGLSLVHRGNCGTGRDGDQLFKQRYLTRRLSSPLKLEELRRVAIVNQASFLKAGPARLLLPVTEEQAEILLALIELRNPSEFPSSLRVDRTHAVSFVADVTRVPMEEGAQKLALHFYRERRPELARDKKEQVLSLKGRLDCEVCGFNFRKRYGSIGDDFCEVHHKTPLHTLENQTKTSLDDLAIVCSNCHRMLHVDSRNVMSISSLKRRLRRP